MAKMILTPTRTSQAVYDICRQKFCRVICDEISVVQKGLKNLVTEQVVAKECPPPPPSSLSRSKTALKIVESPAAVMQNAPPNLTFSMVSGILPTGALGAMGPAGSAGPAGDTGAMGPAGPTGATGAMEGLPLRVRLQIK